MTTIDTSTEAVERLALDHQTVGDNPAKYVMGHPHHWHTAAVLRQLVKERDEAVDAKLDALSTLDAWFDRRKLGNEAVNQAVIDAASGYLRTSRVGGMLQVESDLILDVMQDMSRLGLFADIFARAMNDLVTTLLKERDEARAQLAEVEANALRMAAALAAQIEAAIREMWCLCEDLEDEAYAKLKLKLTEHEQGFWTAQKMTAKRIRRATQMPTNDRTALDRMLAAAPAAVAPSLRITGPNSDGEYWLHIKAGGRYGGVNLGGEHGPICKQLLDAASETGAKE